jgi:hypothetical protein
MTNELEIRVEISPAALQLRTEISIPLEIKATLPQAVELIKIQKDLQPITLVSGELDGNNTGFEWEHRPMFVFWNGQKLVEDAAVNGYTLSGFTTQLTEAPEAGDHLEAYGYFI